MMRFAHSDLFRHKGITTNDSAELRYVRRSDSRLPLTHIPSAQNERTQWSSESKLFPVKRMLDAGTLRFTDAPDTRAEIEHGARDSKSPKPFSRKNEAAPSEKKSELLQKPPLILGEYSTASPNDSSRLRLSLTTPDAAPEPATNVRTFGERDAHMRRSSQSMWDARGVEDAFDDSEENAATTTTTRLNSSAEDEYSVDEYSVEKDSARTASGTASETTEEADGANFSKETRFVTRDLSSLREWTNELRAYKRAFAEDGVNDDAAEKKAGAFLREHLARADAVVDEIVKRRDALAKQTRDAMREGLSSDASMTILNGGAHDPNATLHTRKSRLLRKLQLFDAEAFAALSDVAEAQTRRFFEPLREVSGSMFARFLKSKFSGPGCSEDRAVDFAAIGRAGARLERRAGAGS